MKRTSLVTAGLLAFVLALASCSSKPAGFVSLVPSDALGIVEINDLPGFLKNIDAFTAPLGVKQMTGGQGVGDLLQQMLKSAPDSIDPASLDYSQPLGAAILAPSGADSNPGIIVYVPLKNSAKDTEKFAKLLAKFAPFKSAHSGSYGILYLSSEDLSFPPKQPLLLAKNAEFESGALSAYVDVKGILTRYKDYWALLKTSIESEAQKDEGTMSAAQTAISSDVLKSILDLVDQTEFMTLTLKADADGLSLGSSLGTSVDGSVSSAIKKIGAGSGLLDSAKYLEAASLFNMEFDYDPAGVKDLSKTVIDLYLNAAGLGDADKKAVEALLEETSKISGRKVTVSGDINIDQEAMTEVQGGNLDAIGKAFNVNVVASSEVTDPAAYIATVKRIITEGPFKTYLQSIASATGISVDLGVEDKKDGDFPYQELTIKFNVTDLDKVPEGPQREGIAAVATILDKFHFVLATKAKRVFMVFGADPIAELKNFVANDKASKPLSDTAGFKTFAAMTPKDSQFIGQLSTSRILDIAKTASNGAVAIDIPEEDRTGIYFYTEAKDAVIKSRAFWNSKELAPLFTQLLPLIGSAFMK